MSYFYTTTLLSLFQFRFQCLILAVPASIQGTMNGDPLSVRLPLRPSSWFCPFLMVTINFYTSETLPPQSLDLRVEPQQRLSQLEVLRAHLQLPVKKERPRSALFTPQMTHRKQEKIPSNLPARSSARSARRLSEPCAAPRWPAGPGRC